MRPTGRADQCPKLGVERTQRGRRLWAVHDAGSRRSTLFWRLLGVLAVTPKTIDQMF